MPLAQSDKSTLRREFLRQRDSISSLVWQTKSTQICDRLKSIPWFIEAQTIFAYFSFRQEVDLTTLFSLNKTWAFPRCVGKNLTWHLWQPGAELQSGKYGIKEPVDTAKEISPQTTDLILVPTVACDRQGYRLGYGGGFYDRLLSSPSSSDIPTIGIVFDFAYTTQLPIDSWDIPLKAICSETVFDTY